MLNPIISNVVFLIEMLITYIFFSNMFEKRLSTFKCLGIGCFLYAICSAANIFSHNNGIVNLAVAALINTIFSYTCFESGFNLCTFYSFILSAVNGAIEIAVISTVGTLTGSNFLEYNINLSLLVLECSTSKILYFFVILIFSKVARSRVTRKKISFNLFLYPASTAICQIIFWYINTLPETPYTVQNLLAIASLFLLAATILLFVTYQHQTEKDSEMLRMKNEYEKLQIEKSYFQILEQQNQQLMIYAHDAKNHLAAIKSLNPDPQIIGYVSKLSERLADYTRNCHSGNKLLDVMIHKYSVECEMRGICFEYDVKLCNLNIIEDTDLVAILGNLVDNAITAAEASNRKVISLATANRNSYSVIIIKNSCDTHPQTNGANLITSKANHELHGFGLKSVRTVLKKYQGDFEWDYNEIDHTFTVTVMVGNPI